MSRKPAFGPRSKLNRTLLKVHKWAGLTAAFWLFVLGVTGILLDHDEWRWQRQATVPESWLSVPVSRLLPASVMRYVAAEQANPERWLGASERGLWLSEDRGRNWRAVDFADGSTPQVRGFVAPPDGSLHGLLLATDDGLWRTHGLALTPERLALAGVDVVSLTAGPAPGTVAGLAGHDRAFVLDPAKPGAIRWLAFDEPQIHGLPDEISLADFVFDLHLGYGLGSRRVSTLINDLGGVALIVLSLSGVLYWWFPHRWRRRRGGPASPVKRRRLAWLYRSHAPVIGLLGLLPVLYLSLTAIPLNHVYGFLSWGRDVPLARDWLPPAYSYRSLAGELDGILAYPGEPDRFSVVTRLGVLHTDDAGRTFHADPVIGAASGQLLRERDVEIFSNNGGTHLLRRAGGDWQPIEGPRTMISDAAFVGDVLHLKNSKGFYADTSLGHFETTDSGSPDLSGATFYLFMVDIHTGNIFHEQFKWVSDLIAVLAILLVLSGPVLWWREKWR